MAGKERTSFILLLEHVHTMEELNDAEFGQFIRAYAAYVGDGTEPVFTDRSMRMMWKTVKAFDEMNLKKYSSTSEARSKAGKRGMEKRWSSKSSDSKITNDSKNNNCYFANNKNSLSVSESESESVSESVSESSSSTIVDSDARANTQDDLTTTPIFEEFRARIGKLSQTGQKELPGYVERLGSELVLEIIKKCEDLGGHSWAYVRKALAEAERMGCKSVEEYRKTNPIGAGRNLRVDRSEPSGNDAFKNASRRLQRSLRKIANGGAKSG